MTQNFLKKKIIMSAERVLGIDVGASGIKGAIVDTRTGTLLTERVRIPTPQPSKPKAVAKTFNEIVQQFNWKGQIGCGFPSIIKKGVAYSASNIDDTWLGTNVEKLFTKESGCKVYVKNDADVAGIAEMKYGKGRKKKGTTIFITIGSGLGSAVFIDGVLLPNTELGHLFLEGKIAEQYAADSIRKKEDLSWEKWGKRFNKYLQHVEFLFSPDLIILGGGGSKRFEYYQKYIKLNCKVTPADLLNNAGTIGAACLVPASTTAKKPMTL